MKKLILTLLTLGFITTAAMAEAGGSLTIGLYDDIDRSSMGINGVVFPYKFQRGRFSGGAEFGISLIERFLYENEEMLFDSSASGTAGYDYVWFYNKVYRDYLFIPFGLTARYDLRNNGKLNQVNPSLTLGLGGIFNTYQKTYRRVEDWYDNRPSGPNVTPDYRYIFEFGGESIGTFDLYIKPGVTLYWNRIYLGYEYYINTDYMRHNINIGYVFKL